jgi:hypothetical protein
MIARADNTAMFALIFLVVVAAVCVLGAVYGTDSRHDESVKHRQSLL